MFNIFRPTEVSVCFTVTKWYDVINTYKVVNTLSFQHLYFKYYRTQITHDLRQLTRFTEQNTILIFCIAQLQV